MEQLYRKTDQTRQQACASEETVNFLLAYSRSLSIISSGGMTFEGNLN